MFNSDFRPRGVCSRMIHIGLSDDGNTIEQVSFEGGCNGNLKAISKLVAGHSVDEISGILADQLARGRAEARDAAQA